MLGKNFGDFLGMFGFDKKTILWAIQEALKVLSAEVKYKEAEEDGEKVVYLLIKIKGVDKLE